MTDSLKLTDAILADDAAAEVWGETAVRTGLMPADRAALADLIVTYRDRIAARTGDHCFMEVAARELAEFHGRGPSVPGDLARSWHESRDTVREAFLPTR